MLWKKESHRPDALYIDIFGSDVQIWDGELEFKLLTIKQEPQPGKSNTIALQKRNEGNEKFRRGELINAMELYNDSLRYAELQSEHISLAYANRATCFLRLKMYENCLKDIDLAKLAGYPKHLMSKLDDRKTKCLQEMEDDQQAKPIAELSIDSGDPRFPCLANVAKVQRSKTGGVYSVVATADIDVGQTIAVEKPFTAYLMDRFSGRCNICTKDYVNLMPCTKCAVAMFCPDCHGHFLHESECGLNVCGKSHFNGTHLSVIREILLAVELFPNVDELMAFVEQTPQMKPNELPEHLSDDRAKFQVLFNSSIQTEQSVGYVQFAVRLYAYYKTIMRIPKISKMFASTKHQRFLQHFIGHLHSTFIKNVTLTECFFRRYLIPSGLLKPSMRNYFQHSCNPNALYAIRDGKFIVFAVKPIKPGDELFISYDPHGITDVTQKRQEQLWGKRKIKCVCSRCKGKTASGTQRQQLVSDPAYRYFQENEQYVNIVGATDIEKVKSMLEKSFVLLRKHGRMDGWCDELGRVITFLYCFQYECAANVASLQRPLIQALLTKAYD